MAASGSWPAWPTPARWSTARRSSSACSRRVPRPGSPVRSRPYGAVTVGREGTTLASFTSLAAAGVVGFSDLPAPTTDSGDAPGGTDRSRGPWHAGRHPPGRTVADRGSRGERGAAGDHPGAARRIRGGGGERRLAGRRCASTGERRGARRCAATPAHRAPVGGRIAGAGPIGTRRGPARHLRRGRPPPRAPRRLAGRRPSLVLGRGRLPVGRAASRGRSALPPGHATRSAAAHRRRTPSRSSRRSRTAPSTPSPAITPRRLPSTCSGRSVRRSPGMSSLETTLGLVLETVASGRLSLVRAMRALSLGPWRALDGGRIDLPEPTLRVGSEANLVVFDRADRWTVADGTLRSRGRNTPLMGHCAPRPGAADHRPRPPSPGRTPASTERSGRRGVSQARGRPRRCSTRSSPRPARTTGRWGGRSSATWAVAWRFGRVVAAANVAAATGTTADGPTSRPILRQSSQPSADGCHVPDLVQVAAGWRARPWASKVLGLPSTAGA